MKKKTLKKLLFLGGTATLLLSGRKLLPTYPFSRTYNEYYTKKFNTKNKKTKEKAEVLLDVPLESQFDSPSLENGCEVTSLSCFYLFYGYETTKNQLAEQLDYVPVFNADGTHGDPNEGFVGDISGGDWAMGVYVLLLPLLLNRSSKRIIILYQKQMLN